MSEIQPGKTCIYMKSLLTILTLLLVFLSANSQSLVPSYDLSKYKLPDIKNKSLELNLSGYLSGYKNSVQHTGYDWNKYESNSYNGLIDITFNSFRNSSKYQGTQRVSFDFQPEYYSTETNTSINKRKGYDGTLSIYSNNRFYFQPDLFIEVKPDFYLNKTDEKTEYSNVTGKGTNSLRQAVLSVPVSFGYGRIEPVEDARLALYIIEDLAKVGKLEDAPSESTITDLAREISKIKRKRFFDSRIRRIEELQVIDSFLVANNISSSKDIKYFTSLSDQWDYASGPSRMSGFSVNAGFDNNLTFNKSIQSQALYDAAISKYIYLRTETNTNELSAGAFVRTDYSKPLNLFWQSDLSAISSYNIEFTSDPTDKNEPGKNFNTNIFKTSVNYSIRYLPDSRTSIGLNAGANFTHSTGDRSVSFSEEIKGHLKGNDLVCNAGINMYYYFSPQLRLKLDWTLYSDSSKSSTVFETMLDESTTKSTNLDNRFSVQLLYSFF
jgi:hypothetical protein